MGVSREISWFEKDGDELIGDINVDHIPFDRLKEIFTPLTDDPLLYYVYSINPVQSSLLTEWVELTFDYTKYQYFLYCWDA
jgi:hypothetical protein